MDDFLVILYPQLFLLSITQAFNHHRMATVSLSRHFNRISVENMSTDLPQIIFIKMPVQF